MTRNKMSRRNLLATGAFALAGAATLPAKAEANNEEIIHQWYEAWVKNDLDTFNRLLADDFTFSSAAGDDHISKSRFKTSASRASRHSH